MKVHLDEPAPGSRCDPLCCRVAGKVDGAEDLHQLERLDFHLDGKLIGSTSLLWRENDSLAFEHFAHMAGAATSQQGRLEVHLVRRGQRPLGPAAACDLQFIDHDYRRNDYGVLLSPQTSWVHHRVNIYATGPSQAGGSDAVLQLIRRHLGPVPSRVLDVGCGLGWYGQNLLHDGYGWCGAEIKAEDCAELERRGLPHFQVDGRTLPFADGAFDAAMAIEVLEHTPDPQSFLSEIRRVAPRRLLISVPNLEPIPYLQRYQAVPWHLLEGDHKNFFTRWNLGPLLREFYPSVEVLCYHPLPLATAEGIPLYNHLFAVAWRPA